MITQATVADRVLVFAQMRHGEFSAREPSPCYGEPLSVALKAVALFDHFYSGDFSQSRQSRAEQAMTAGVMVYAMELYGLNFEQLARASDAGAAHIVAGLSPDIRLPLSKRTAFHCSHLSQADAASQLVRLAEIICVARQLEALDEATRREYAAEIRQWADDQIQLASAMRELHAARKMAGTLKGLRQLLDKLIASVTPRAAVVVTAEPI